MTPKISINTLPNISYKHLIIIFAERKCSSYQWGLPRLQGVPWYFRKVRMASRYWNSLSLTGHYRNVRGGAGVGVEEGQYEGVMKIIAESARKERVVAKQGKINTHRRRPRRSQCMYSWHNHHQSKVFLCFQNSERSFYFLHPSLLVLDNLQLLCLLLCLLGFLCHNLVLDSTGPWYSTRSDYCQDSNKTLLQGTWSQNTGGQGDMWSVWRTW